MTRLHLCSVYRHLGLVIRARNDGRLCAGDGAAVVVQQPSSSGSRFGEKSTAVGCPLNGLDLCGRIRSRVVNLGRRSCIGRIRARTGSLYVGSDPSGWFIIGRELSVWDRGAVDLKSNGRHSVPVRYILDLIWALGWKSNGRDHKIPLRLKPFA